MQFRIIKIFFFTILGLISTGKLYAQSNTWFKTKWQGVAYLMDKDPDQNYELFINIQSLKGDKFEGNCQTIYFAIDAVKCYLHCIKSFFDLLDESFFEYLQVF